MPFTIMPASPSLGTFWEKCHSRGGRVHVFTSSRKASNLGNGIFHHTKRKMAVFGMVIPFALKIPLLTNNLAYFLVVLNSGYDKDESFLSDFLSMVVSFRAAAESVFSGLAMELLNSRRCLALRMLSQSRSFYCAPHREWKKDYADSPSTKSTF